jgi:hypothetical protein
MKQETLKEATNKYANKNGDIPTTELEDAIFKQGFIDGAKWQQKQDKNKYKEEAKGKILCTVDNLIELAKIIQNTYDLEKLTEIKNYIIKN